MTCLLMVKGLWSCLDEVQPQLTCAFEIMQHWNCMHEAMGMTSLNILDTLLFHLEGCTTLWAMWIKFHTLFGTINKFRALQIEVELNSLALDSFPTIDDFMMKFKSLRS